MDWQNVLGIVGLIVAVPAAIGAALALMRGAYYKARLEDSDKDVERLRGRQGELEHNEKLLEERIRSLTDQNAVLHEAVTQRAALDAHHQASVAAWDAMASILGQILAEMRDARNV